MKVLFFGCGQMGGAILKGVLDAGVVKNENILVYDASAERLTQLEKEGVPVEGAPAAALEQGELIILGIKPQVFSLIKENLYKMISKKPKVIVSIMAGVTLDMLKKDLGSQHTYIRTMPNLPLAIGQGATAISHEGVPAEIVQEVDDIFKSVGVVAHVSEGQMNAVTGVSGSGPAWAFEFIEGWIRGGVCDAVRVAVRMTSRAVLFVHNRPLRLGITSQKRQGSGDGNPRRRAGEFLCPLRLLRTLGESFLVVRAVEVVAIRSVR